MESLVIHGLSVNDFRLFEDGQQQMVHSVALESPGFALVGDNFGKHPEIIGVGGGRWSYPDRPSSDSSQWLAWPQYVIAYVPPPSPVGSCHTIQVKVNRSHVIVWARGEYCNTKHLASDPLDGTEFGKQMEADLASTTQSKIDLTLLAVPFYRDAGQARVYIELEFPWKSIKYEFKNSILYASIGTLLFVYHKDGSLAARFSDFACCDYGSGVKAPAKGQTSEFLSDQHRSIIPTRYETQIDLPAGEYELRAILSDGEKFGRKQIPLTVDPYDGKQLTLSEIALSRRARKLPAESLGLPAKLPGAYVPLVSKGVEFTPTMSPRFKKDELLYAYFEVNDPQLQEGSATTVEAHLRILDANTSKMKLDFDPVSATAYVNAGSSLIPIGRGIPLSTLADGPYQLDVQATDSAGKSTPRRTANFVVDTGDVPNIVLPPAPRIIPVTLNITALDSQGNPVTDLTVADFQVFDGDKPQMITALLLMTAQPDGDSPPPSMTYKLVYNSQSPTINFDQLRVVCTRKNVRIELAQAYFDTPP
jgi:hypothetical protein